MNGLDQREDAEDEPILMLGELSRGIAHDLKNFLTAIQGNAEMALRSEAEPEARERALQMVIRASMSARDLCNQVLSYSQNKALPRTVFDVRELIEEAGMISEAVVDETITLRFRLSEAPVVVEANHSQTLQVVLNLIANAVHALEETGGRIEVSLQAESGRCVIEVRDTGPGIAEEHRAHLFQAGYTTKLFGMATGLGLALAKRITEEHDGQIALLSGDSGNTCFQVRLPLSNKEPDRLKIPKAAPEKVFKKRNVLLVDDEEFMRSLGIDILQSLGYRVTVSESGKSGLELFTKNPNYFDIILSDSRMPEMSGEELAIEVKKLRPDLPFVLVTAFATGDSGSNLMAKGIDAIVAKPFLIDDLRKALDSALAG